MTPAKAANVLVDDDTSCVIADFGQSEMKSEVYRITRMSQPRTFFCSRYDPLTLDCIRPCLHCRWDITLASARADARRRNPDVRDGCLRVCHLLLGDSQNGSPTVAAYGRQCRPPFRVEWVSSPSFSLSLRFVVILDVGPDENMRPPLPPSNPFSGHLMKVISASWDRDPSKRPSFEQIARELK